MSADGINDRLAAFENCPRTQKVGRLSMPIDTGYATYPGWRVDNDDTLFRCSSDIDLGVH